MAFPAGSNFEAEGFDYFLFLKQKDWVFDPPRKSFFRIRAFVPGLGSPAQLGSEFTGGPGRA